MAAVSSGAQGCSFATLDAEAAIAPPRSTPLSTALKAQLGGLQGGLASRATLWLISPTPPPTPAQHDPAWGVSARERSSGGPSLSCKCNLGRCRIVSSIQETALVERAASQENQVSRPFQSRNAAKQEGGQAPRAPGARSCPFPPPAESGRQPLPCLLF